MIFDIWTRLYKNYLVLTKPCPTKFWEQLRNSQQFYYTTANTGLDRYSHSRSCITFLYLSLHQQYKTIQRVYRNSNQSLLIVFRNDCSESCTNSHLSLCISMVRFETGVALQESVVIKTSICLSMQSISFDVKCFILY